jgi:hypothetical protein
MPQSDASSPFIVTILPLPRAVTVALRFRLKNVVQTVSYALYKTLPLLLLSCLFEIWRVDHISHENYQYASLWSLENLDSWFESPSGHGCISVSLCCHVQVEALKWPISHPNSQIKYLKQKKKKKGTDGEGRTEGSEWAGEKTGRCIKKRPSGLRHEISSPTQTPGSWVRIPLKIWKSVFVYSAFVCRPV